MLLGLPFEAGLLAGMARWIGRELLLGVRRALKKSCPNAQPSEDFVVMEPVDERGKGPRGSRAGAWVPRRRLRSPQEGAASECPRHPDHLCGS